MNCSTCHAQPPAFLHLLHVEALVRNKLLPAGIGVAVVGGTFWNALAQHGEFGIDVRIGDGRLRLQRHLLLDQGAVNEAVDQVVL